MIFNLIIVIIYLLLYLNFLFGISFLPIIIMYCYFSDYLLYINIIKNIIWSSVSFITYGLLFKNIYVNSNEYIN